MCFPLVQVCETILNNLDRVVANISKKCYMSCTNIMLKRYYGNLKMQLYIAKTNST